jgi:hypothetical protein
MCMYLLSDGLFRENGVFSVMPKIDIHPLAELFRANILKMLKKEGRIVSLVKSTPATGITPVT